ncbi:MAG: tRNA pseudouridine(38-40) synthase TruA [Candidatus Dormibacteraeota bacterium]|nr:tRNA pseudouridine(38-40) synthase TruA [Candidatus Dormibacteraeota bacterium]
MNIKVVLEYDGTGFSGWQQQASRRTVEGELKRALEQLTGKRIAVYGAGRTDAGAHALGQVVNFRLPEESLGVPRLVAALNAKLPADVSALSATEVPDQFHARYAAIGRRYRYRYLDRPARPALERDRCWHLPGPLDERAMGEAAGALVGQHDWTSFCSASEPAATRTRAMRAAAVRRSGEFVELELEAEGFLRGLVRGIAGALAEVGRARRSPEWVGELLAARDRRRTATDLVKTAPAGGLTLLEVIYRPEAMKETS